MSRVGVGVPVYNGGEVLRESLECLRTQSFEDIEILLGDNASTDETGDICAEYAARDSRFKHIRRPDNLGSLPNFVDLRRQSRSELFMWRAYDDLSEPNFIEELVGCFDHDPQIRLAVSEIRSQPDDRPAPRITRYQPAPRWPRIAGVAHRLFRSHASWIYGLWHRETLAREQDRVHEAYPHAWGWDHLCMLPLMLDGQVAGTNSTSFEQRILRQGTTSAERKAKLPGVSFMHGLRADFARVTWETVKAREWSTAERFALNTMIPIYIDRRGYSRFKLFRRRLRERSR